MFRSLAKTAFFKTASNDDLAELLRILPHLEAYHGGFYADKKFTIPLTTEQIQKILGYESWYSWNVMRDKLIKGGILEIGPNNGLICPLLLDKTVSLDDELLSLSRWALELWNSKQIMVHKETPALLNKIGKLIRKHEYTRELIEDSIGNYAKVMNSPDHFWSKKWTLCDFLSRGVVRFSSDENPLEVFKKGFAKKKTTPTIESLRQQYCNLDDI
jgi:hypothetical protein